MLYWLLPPLREYFFFFNVFGYITVRTALAGVTALLITLVFGPWMIRQLKRRQLGEEIRELGPRSHQAKRGTPSMGGILIIASTLFPTLLWADLGNIYVWLAIFTMLSFGLVGFADDYLKIRKKKSKGLIPRYKLLWQALLSAAVAGVLIWLGKSGAFDLHLSVPFIKTWAPYLGLFYLPWIMLIMVGSSNAVNLADGLDGLAIGLTLISVTAMTVLAYTAGNIRWSEYLQIPYAAQGAELTIFLGAMFGACLGFLWYNCHPAEIFMGDVGALSLGATLSAVAMMIKQELLLPLVAGVFILEALSVMLQVSYFKLSGGKRIFRMAPLHHHFELAGWSEQKVVVRFWITAIFFALFSLTTLKLR